MKKLMRCLFCGLLQDEPVGVKVCQRCGGELVFEQAPQQFGQDSYLNLQMELDQVNAPAGQTVDRYLLVTIKTPAKVPDEHLAKTESGRPPLSFNVVLDVSGSMHGAKIEHTKQALRLAARTLHDGDKLAMTVFSDNARIVMEAKPFNQGLRQTFESLIQELQPGGSTALYSGLDVGLQQAEEMRSDNNLSLLLSDGQANIGETDLEIIGRLAKNAAEKGLIVSTLGVGMDYNEALMTEIATQGKGRFYHVQTPDEIVPFMTAELGEAADMAARDVKIHIQLPASAALIPLSAAYQSEIQDGVATISIGDIPTDLEVEIPLRLTLFSGKANERLGIEGAVTYISPAEKQLKASINRVTVRFIKQDQYQLEKGVVEPVVARIAEQMHAKQILNYSRAFTRRDEKEIERLEAERSRFQTYVQLLDNDSQEKYLREMDEDLYSIRSSSPVVKNLVSNAFQTSRSMRGREKKK